MITKVLIWLIMTLFLLSGISSLFDQVELFPNDKLIGVAVGLIGFVFFLLMYLDIKRAEKQIPLPQPSKEEGHEGELVPIECPYCGSHDVRKISYTQQMIRSFFLIRLLGIALYCLLGLKRLDFEYCCMNCKGEWK